MHKLGDTPQNIIKKTKKCERIFKNYEHEILWHLEFDGLVKELGAGVGIWIYIFENDHSKGHA